MRLRQPHLPRVFRPFDPFRPRYGLLSCSAKWLELRQNRRVQSCRPARASAGSRARLLSVSLLVEGRTMDAQTRANIQTGTITLGDKSYSFPVYDGTIGPEVLDVSKLYAEAGIFTYDPGFTSTGSCESKITYIDGDQGILLYRGYPIADLAEHGDFLETCY